MRFINKIGLTLIIVGLNSASVAKESDGINLNIASTIAIIGMGLFLLFDDEGKRE